MIADVTKVSAVQLYYVRVAFSAALGAIEKIYDVGRAIR